MTTRSVAAAVAVLAAAVVLAATLGGCGVTTEERPRAIDPPRGPFQALASPSPAATTGPIAYTLCLVKDNRLVPVARHRTTAPTLDGLADALIAGPTDSERDQGITSALSGSNIVAAIRASGGRATVELAAPIDKAPRTDEVLAYAQLVCTLTTRPEVGGVIFTRDGKPVGVPRADGSLSQGPLTRTDYAPLIG